LIYHRGDKNGRHDGRSGSDNWNGHRSGNRLGGWCEDSTNVLREKIRSITDRQTDRQTDRERERERERERLHLPINCLNVSQDNIGVLGLCAEVSYGQGLFGSIDTFRFAVELELGSTVM
jgi:hypothetical protein